MRYLLLINADETMEADISPERMGEILEGYGRFGAELEKAGASLESARLQPAAAATTVRVRDGKLTTTDGPFAETKEALGGFYMIEAPDLDAAIAWAAKIPTAQYGSIEVRPLWEEEDFDVPAGDLAR